MANQNLFYTGNDAYVRAADLVILFYIYGSNLPNMVSVASVAACDARASVKMPGWSNIIASILLYPGTFTDTILLSSGYFLQKRSIRWYISALEA